jgi:ABC-type lipoprotein release transport system permease subunit
MMSIALRTALRNTFRNTRRSVLTAVGIGVGCVLATTTTGLMDGQAHMILSAAPEGGVGHVKVVPAGWAAQQDNALRLADWRATRKVIDDTSGVAVAAPRVRLDATLGFGTRIIHAEMVGVDPAVEQRAFLPARTVVAGRYLEPADADAVVLGNTAVDRLDVEVGDDVFVTVVDARGEMVSTMLELVGVTSTGSADIDAGVCHVNLPDAERLWGELGAGEIAVILEDAARTDAFAAALRRELGEDTAALAWYEVAPDLKVAADITIEYVSLATGVMLLVVFLGVVSAQLAAVLERRHEFAILVALGMKPRQIAFLVTAEALALGAVGAVLGLAIGLPVVWYLSTTGFDLGMFMDIEVTSGGMLFDKVWRAQMGAWVVTETLFIAFGSTLLASVYPAWFAIRTDPAEALRAAG